MNVSQSPIFGKTFRRLYFISKWVIKIEFHPQDISTSDISTSTRPIAPRQVSYSFSGIRVRVIFGKKTLKKKHLCRHDKNYYYFWKWNIAVISLILDSRNMIKVSKNISLQKIR